MAIEYENTPVEWQNQGTEPSEDLKKNGFQAGYKPPAQVFNYLQNNISSCLNELQAKLNELSNAVNELPGDVGETVGQMQTDITNINSSIDQIQTDLTTLDEDAIKGVKGNGTTINPSSTGIINITPNNIGAAASTHYHSATQITSGTLPVERGGTGSATAEEIRENLGLAATDLSNVDNEVFADKATSAGVASGTVLFYDDSGQGAYVNCDEMKNSPVKLYFSEVTLEDYEYVEIWGRKAWDHQKFTVYPKLITNRSTWSGYQQWTTGLVSESSNYVLSFGYWIYAEDTSVIDDNTGFWGFIGQGCAIYKIIGYK